jgi:hypothetical protein
VGVICKHSSVISLTETCIYIYAQEYHSVTISLKKFFITNPLILEEQNSFKIKFPGNMHNYIWCPYYLPSFMKLCSVVSEELHWQAASVINFGKFPIWNSTCNPCFSTFDQFFFVFHGLKTSFFCYSLKFNFICYLNRSFTFDYSLWDGGRHTFLRAKTNFNFILNLILNIFFIYIINTITNWRKKKLLLIHETQKKIDQKC